MHIAVAMGTLLLGGWVLNGPADENGVTAPEQAQPPAAGMPSQPYRPSPSDRSQGRGMQGGSRGPMRGQSGAMQRNVASGIPFAPTDSLPAGAEGAMGQPTAPTSNLPLTDTSPMNMGMPRATRSYTPSAPTSRRSSSQSGLRPASHGLLGQTENRGMSQPNLNIANSMPPSNYTVGPSAASSGEKAFSGYRAPSGISPYMNLFRRSGEGVDNYSTLVRPELDQRFLNRQLGGEIRGLQRDTRMQRSNLQQLNRDNRTLQGVGTPQFYQNTGSYYPAQGQ